MYPIKESHAEALPKWTPRDLVPLPISLARALALVKAEFQKMPIKPTIRDIQFVNGRSDASQTIWFYNFICKLEQFFCLAVFLVCTHCVKATGTDFSSDGSGNPHPDYTVDEAHLARLPRWTLEDSTPPPLEFNDALRLMRARVQRQIPNKDWRLRQAFLRRKDDAEGTVVYYEFTVDYRRKEVRDSWEECWVIIVLMDGTVLASDAK